MTLSTDSQRAIDSYLAALRKQLRDLMEEDVNDIVEEIRAHILDKTATAAVPEQVEQTLKALGTPETLASRYRTEELMKRAHAHRSGAQVALLVIQRIGAVLFGLAAFAVSIVGYCIGGGLVVLAVMKIVWPHGTGLWESRGPGADWGLSFSGGSGTAPPNSHDLLGWWLVPIGFVVGTGLFYATYRFGAWVIRMLRRPRRLRYAANEQQVES